MSLTYAQLMVSPGGPGDIGAVKAGTGIQITPQGVISATPQGGDIPPGSIMIFQNQSAPTGWTQRTDNNNIAIRLVSSGGGGTGGSVDFTSAFTNQGVSGSVSLSGLSFSNGSTNTVNQTPGGSVSLSGLTAQSTSISTAQMPSHQHTYQKSNDQNADKASGSGTVNRGMNAAQDDAAGGNGGHTHGVSGSASFSGQQFSHSHTVSGSISGSASFSGNSINLSVRYVDYIACTKS